MQNLRKLEVREVLEMSENEVIKSYSFAEAVIEKLSPLSWCEETGGLVVDEAAIAEDGQEYVKAYAGVAVVLLCLALLAVDAFPSTVTAMTFAVVASIGAAGAAVVSASTMLMYRRLR